MFEVESLHLGYCFKHPLQLLHCIQDPFDSRVALESVLMHLKRELKVHHASDHQ